MEPKLLRQRLERKRVGLRVTRGLAATPLPAGEFEAEA